MGRRAGPPTRISAAGGIHPRGRGWKRRPRCWRVLDPPTWSLGDHVHREHRPDRRGQSPRARGRPWRRLNPPAALPRGPGEHHRRAARPRPSAVAGGGEGNSTPSTSPHHPEPGFIPDTTNLKGPTGGVLEAPRHYRLVVDEYGADWLVTLEQLGRSRRDRHGTTPRAGRAQAARRSVHVDGQITVRDLNRPWMGLPRTMR